MCEGLILDQTGLLSVSGHTGLGANQASSFDWSHTISQAPPLTGAGLQWFQFTPQTPNSFASVFSFIYSTPLGLLLNFTQSTQSS